jgi:hypothetical protein
MAPAPVAPTINNMQLSYRLPSYTTLLAQMLASNQLQAFKAIERMGLPWSQFCATHDPQLVAIILLSYLERNESDCALHMPAQLAQLLISLLLAALLLQADMMMRKMFRTVSNPLQTSPLATTHKAQLLQLLSASIMQLAQHMPASYTLMMRPMFVPITSYTLMMRPMCVPTYMFIHIRYHMQLAKIAPTGYIVPVKIPTYQMMGMSLVLPTNNLQQAVSTTYCTSLQGYSLVTYMPLGLQLSSPVTCSCMWPMFSGLQLSALNSSLMQPLGPSCLLLTSTTYTLMRPMGLNTMMVAALNLSLWQLRTSSSSQLFVVTYTLRLATLQLVTHLELTMQHAGYSTAVGASLPCLSASLTALEPQHYLLAALSAFTFSSYTVCSYKPFMPSTYSPLPLNIAAKPPTNSCSSGSTQGLQASCSSVDKSQSCESEGGAAAPKRPSMRSAVKCAVLGLANSVLNSVAAGLVQYVIKAVDFWS